MTHTVSHYWKDIQLKLFVEMDEELPEALKCHRRVLLTLETIRPEKYISDNQMRGRPEANRRALLRAFIAKAVLNIPTNEELRDRLVIDKILRRICGWSTIRQIPSLSTFSRAFFEFTRMQLPQRIHKELISVIYNEQVVEHISRDATDIPVRAGKQKSKKDSNTPKPKRKKQEKPTRCERQMSGSMTTEEMIEELPKKCDIGRKNSSKGRVYNWVGYKLHVDVTDQMIPVSCVLTSASVHDSQVAIPLSEMSSKRITAMYELMDSGYYVKAIKSYSELTGRKAIIAFCPKSKKIKKEHEAELLARRILNWKPAEDIRYKNRTVVERFFSNMKDNHGARSIWVKGHEKVFCHLMFGILAVTVKQLHNFLS